MSICPPSQSEQSGCHDGRQTTLFLTSLGSCQNLTYKKTSWGENYNKFTKEIILYFNEKQKCRSSSQMYGNQVISAFVFQSLSIFCEQLCIKIQLCMLENASNLYFKIGLRLLF